VASFKSFEQLLSLQNDTIAARFKGSREINPENVSLLNHAGTLH
jgi:hypothetical protein